MFTGDSAWCCVLMIQAPWHRGARHSSSGSNGRARTGKRDTESRRGLGAGYKWIQQWKGLTRIRSKLVAEGSFLPNQDLERLHMFCTETSGIQDVPQEKEAAEGV